MNEKEIEKVLETYNYIKQQQEAGSELAGQCKTCGNCCNLEKFGHRLFVTPAEIEYLEFHLGKDAIKSMHNGICPYRVDDKCSVYDYRFAGCRIFNCTGDKDFQSRLTESVLGRLKNLCPDSTYCYFELSIALNTRARKNME
jgi:hypothetical protein